MNKNRSLILITLFLLALSAKASALAGDVNGDTQVTVVDALFVSQYSVGLRTLASQQLSVADANCDGNINVVDALFIAQYTVGLRSSFCSILTPTATPTPAFTPTPTLTPTVTATPTVTPTSTASPNQISISPSSFALYPNETIQLSATIRYSDGSTQDITNSAVWSSNTSTASVSSSGLVKGIFSGTATIKASYSGAEGSSTISITAKSFVSNYSTIKNSTFGASAAPWANSEGWVNFKELGTHYMRMPINLFKGVVVDNVFLSQYDNYVKDGQTYGLIMYGIVNPTKNQNNEWTNATEFANNMKTIVERYDGDGASDMQGLQYPIKNWELHNEINYGTNCQNDTNCQWKGFTKDMYMDFMNKSRTALKEACTDCNLLNGAQVNPPSKQIQFEGSSPLKDLIDGKGTGVIDAISYHDYEENLDADQAVIDFASYGLHNKPVWVTETDMQNEWNKNKNLTQNDNARLYVRSLVYGLYKGLDKLISASMKASSQDPEFVQWGSLIDSSTGSKRKVYYAYKKLIEKTDYFSSVTTASPHNGATVYAFKFTVEGKPVYVLWATSNQTVNLGLSSNSASGVKITKTVPDDENGTIATQYKPVSGGSVGLDLTTTGIYVEELT